MVRLECLLTDCLALTLAIWEVLEVLLNPRIRIFFLHPDTWEVFFLIAECVHSSPPAVTSKSCTYSRFLFQFHKIKTH